MSLLCASYGSLRKTMSNKVLARALYASTPLDREIPQEFYGTVAEILVYVFKENHKVIL